MYIIQYHTGINCLLQIENSLVEQNNAWMLNHVCLTRCCSSSKDAPCKLPKSHMTVVHCNGHKVED